MFWASFIGELADALDALSIPMCSARACEDAAAERTWHGAANLEDVACRQNALVVTAGERAVDEVPELLVRQMTLSRHPAWG